MDFDAAEALGFQIILISHHATAAFAPYADKILRLPDPPVQFRQITFRRGQVSGARFAEGSRNILYAAQWEDEPRRIYEAHVGDPVSRILGFEGLSLVAVSRLGELAVARALRNGSLEALLLDVQVSEAYPLWALLPPGRRGAHG